MSKLLLTFILSYFSYDLRFSMLAVSYCETPGKPINTYMKYTYGYNFGF